jgi:hypothetical protein
MSPCIAAACTPWRPSFRDEPVRSALRPHEDERRVRAAEVLDERLDLRVRRHRHEAVLDLGRLVA